MKTSFGILHRDLSLWNLSMVAQARSDWPVDREWKLEELKRCWESVPVDIRSKIRRGLLIDWGFAAIEGSPGLNVELTEQDLTVYPPVSSDSRWLVTRDITFDEAETGRHCLPGVSSSFKPEGRFLIPPLWIPNEHTKELEVNPYTNSFLTKAATDGQLDVDWVNDTLKKQEEVSSTVTVSNDFE
jgi:hypothetical protein